MSRKLSFSGNGVPSSGNALRGSAAFRMVSAARCAACGFFSSRNRYKLSTSRKACGITRLLRAWTVVSFCQILQPCHGNFMADLARRSGDLTGRGGLCKTKFPVTLTTLRSLRPSRHRLSSQGGWIRLGLLFSALRSLQGSGPNRDPA